jgi:hypothetical protein
MKQGNLFDDLYVEQQTDAQYEPPGHMKCDGLYDESVDGVIKQRLVTYSRDSSGNIKRTEKVRNFQAKEFHDLTTVEVIK